MTRHKNIPKNPSSAPVITYSVSNPEEKEPQKLGYKWRGSNNDPKKIVIKSIGIDAFIQNVGVDQNKEIAVPNNIHIAGWFVNSVRPGDMGLSIIDGHVNGVSKDKGVFKRLPELKEKDIVKIVFGDNSQISFIVKKNIAVPNDESAALLFSQDPKISKQLNLVTCTGKFNRQQHQYEKRQITVLSKLE